MLPILADLEASDNNKNKKCIVHNEYVCVKVERDHKENMAKLVREEKLIKDENVRLQRRLQMEVDRREALCRHLSESESSLEMDDERHFNESTRVRTISSPIPSYVVAPGTAAAAVAAGNASISMIAGHPVIATTTASSAAAAIPNSSPFITGKNRVLIALRNTLVKEFLNVYFVIQIL